MDTFWSLLKESIITQAVLTVMIWGAVVYLAVTHQAIPEILTAGGMGILGFWFGAKITAAAYASGNK